jgi:membrane protease YdiL (CAAX protease family)
MDTRYKQEVTKYVKKDGIIAICLFAYWIVLFSVLGIIEVESEISNSTWEIIRIIIAFINIFIVFAIVLIRKQGLASIGLHKKNLWPALCLGLLFVPIPLILRGILPGLLNDWELNSPVSLVLILANSALMAVREDITFVGFIQTRLYGLVKNDYWAINLGATLFTLAHLPQVVIAGIPMGVINLVIALVFWFFMHRAFIMLFKRYFSLVPVFIMHTATNFSGRIWQGGRIDGFDFGLATASLAFIFAVEIWYWYTHRTSKASEQK